MRLHCLATVTAAVVAVSGVAGCTADEQRRAPATSSSPPASPTAAVLGSAAALAAAMRSGNTVTATARLAVRGSGACGSFTVDGVVAHSAGSVTGLRMSGAFPGGGVPLELLITRGVTYLRPVPADGTAVPGSDVRWRELYGSSDPTISAVTGCVAAIVAVTGLDRIAAAVGAASSFEPVGQVVGGQRYRVSGFAPAGTGLAAVGRRSAVPTRASVDVDAQGRTVAVSALFTVDGVGYSADASWSDFGTAVDLRPLGPGEYVIE